MQLLDFNNAALYFLFLFSSSRAHQDLHSFPTRRSSDLHLRQLILIYKGKQAREEVAGRRCRHGKHGLDRKSTRLNSSHTVISYAVFCLKKKKTCVFLRREVASYKAKRPMTKIRLILTLV